MAVRLPVPERSRVQRLPRMLVPVNVLGFTAADYNAAKPARGPGVEVPAWLAALAAGLSAAFLTYLGVLFGYCAGWL